MAHEIGHCRLRHTAIRLPLTLAIEFPTLTPVVVVPARAVLAWRDRAQERAADGFALRLLEQPTRFLTARLVGSVLSTGKTLTLAVVGVVPAVLGAGVGAEVGLLWSARKTASSSGPTVAGCCGRFAGRRASPRCTPPPFDRVCSKRGGSG